MIPNLGRVLGILMRAEARERLPYQDLALWQTAAECRYLEGAEIGRMRLARKLAEATARRPFRAIRREAARRGLPIEEGSRRYYKAFERLST